MNSAACCNRDAYFVSATAPASNKVWVFGVELTLQRDIVIYDGIGYTHYGCYNPRIDLIVMPNSYPWHGEYCKVIHGSPSPSPIRPFTPEGWTAVAIVRYDPEGQSVLQSNIEELLKV